MIVGVDALRAGIGDATRTLVDARAPERYAGKIEPIDKVAGHIPAAVNHFFQRNLDRAGLFRTPEELRAEWRDTIGATAPDQIVCYCGSGVTACHNLLALEHAGLTGARSSIPDRGASGRAIRRGLSNDSGKHARPNGTVRDYSWLLPTRCVNSV